MICLYRIVLICTPIITSRGVKDILYRISRGYITTCGKSQTILNVLISAVTIVVLRPGICENEKSDESSES